ncbi:hypothetical protein N8G13_00410 [Mycoplasma zalophi]|uniref:hypothetical protein n=1 Tax=Mycoplasma zalophi TaxID=191287 RepID=UPI0021C928E6|nr:hypothetical protein [Mycoplasma zalophi]MCU4116928.1 hypothetical protein [Mycoplasma zalophi]
MLDPKDVKDANAPEEEGAPAVVGTLKVSNDLLDFSAFSKTKKTESKQEAKAEDEGNLTPRQKAILERKRKEAEKANGGNE